MAVIARSRKYSQYVRMVEDALANRCPFCQIDRSYNKVVAENEYWYSWPSRPPEENTRLHFLFVPNRHITDSEELSGAEVIALFDLRKEVRKMFGYTSRGFMMRDGDARLSAGTIQHLHAHDMVPDGNGRVESPFFKGCKSEEEGVRRAIIFEKVRQADSQNILTDAERELVKDRME